jgi:hypothetical protein
VLGVPKFKSKCELVFEETRMPVHIWVEAEIRRLASEGYGVYVAARGDKTGGIVLQKISNLQGQCRLLIQQRELNGKLGWVDALGVEIADEKQADSYIHRATERDPDLWVIEIEDRSMTAVMQAGNL